MDSGKKKILPTGWKEAEEKDLDLLHGMEKEIFREGAWARESIRSHLGLHPGWLSEGVGYILFLDLGDSAELLRIGILPEKRKKGEGEAALGSLCEAYKEVFLEVSERNSPAISLYKKSGFQELGKRKSYYGPGEDAILMKHSEPRT